MRGNELGRILIVGGAGYVGGFMTDEAIRFGHEVIVIDNLTYEDTYFKDVDFRFGDVTDHEFINSNLKNIDCVIWLAALVGDPACAINPYLTLQINVESIRNLVKNYDGKIIFPSTCSVYGAQEGLLNEKSTLNPLSLYAESKLEAERILLESKSSPTIFRLGTLFGLSDSHARLRVDLVLNVLTIRAFLEGKMSVFGGKQYRPLLHVKDVATAAIASLQNDSIGVYNLLSENVTILELAERIQKILPNTNLEVTSMSFQDSRNYRVDGNLAKEVLHFSPKYTIEDGIAEILKLLKEKRIKDISNPRFINSELLRLRIEAQN